MKIKPKTKLNLERVEGVLTRWLPLVLVILTAFLIYLTVQLTLLNAALTKESTSTAVLIFVGGNVNYFLTPTNNTFATISEGSSYGGAAYLNLPTDCSYLENFNISIPFSFTGNPQTRVNVSIFLLHNATISVSGNGVNNTYQVSPIKLPVNISILGVSITNFYNNSESFKLEQLKGYNFTERGSFPPNTYLLNVRIGLEGYLNSSINYSHNPYLAFSIFTILSPSTISINDYSVYENVIRPENSTRIVGNLCFPFNANYN